MYGRALFMSFKNKKETQKSPSIVKIEQVLLERNIRKKNFTGRVHTWMQFLEDRPLKSHAEYFDEQLGGGRGPGCRFYPHSVLKVLKHS